MCALFSLYEEGKYSQKVISNSVHLLQVSGQNKLLLLQPFNILDVKKKIRKNLYNKLQQLLK